MRRVSLAPDSNELDREMTLQTKEELAELIDTKLDDKVMDIMLLVEEAITLGQSYNSFEEWKKAYYNYSRVVSMMIQEHTEWLTETQGKLWPKKLHEVKEWPDVDLNTSRITKE